MSSSGFEFDALLVAMNRRFQALGNVPLFTTDVMPERLWHEYIMSFPAPERQFHNCNACRHFIERFGGLVAIDGVGGTTPAIFNFEALDNGLFPTYAPGIEAIAKVVKRARVTGVFVSSKPIWGTALSDGWSHFHVRPHAAQVHSSRTQTAHQRMCEHKEDFITLQRALSEFSRLHLEQAVAFLTASSVYRGEKFLAHAQWLLECYNNRHTVNLIWRAVAMAPAGYCHPRASMIGSLLEDLEKGLPLDKVKRRFEEKVAPSVYQRAQAAPTVGALQAAEDLVAKLGIAPSLERRYARLSELKTIWRSGMTQKLAKQPKPGVFGHLAAKDALQPLSQGMGTAPVVMTWDKFQRTVLPSAAVIEALVPPTDDRFAALVGPVHADAPPILAWDGEGGRIPFSWYYASGIDAEIKRRVVGAGGKYEDCDIRASLIWNDRNDLDLHCRTPAGREIYFGSKIDGTGGALDVDMNVRGETTTPVENIRWAKGTAREGRYEFWVENYRYHEFSRGPVPFRVELEVNGERFAYEGATAAGTTHSRHLVASVLYVPGKPGNWVGGNMRPAATPGGSWGVRPGSYVQVTGIVPSPNTWLWQTNPPNGRHMFFILQGCKDGNPSNGRGFFTEMLKSDLRPARAVLEAYNAKAEIAGLDEADACGLGMTDQSPWDLTLRVTMVGGIVATYKIDRWD